MTLRTRRSLRTRRFLRIPNCPVCNGPLTPVFHNREELMSGENSGWKCNNVECPSSYYPKGDERLVRKTVDVCSVINSIYRAFSKDEAVKIFNSLRGISSNIFVEFCLFPDKAICSAYLQRELKISQQNIQRCLTKLRELNLITPVKDYPFNDFSPRVFYVLSEELKK